MATLLLASAAILGHAADTVSTEAIKSTAAGDRKPAAEEEKLAALDEKSVGNSSTDKKRKPVLSTVRVQGRRLDQKTSVVPVRAPSSVYGNNATVLDTPRSVSQVNAEQLSGDVIRSADELVKYAPGITRGGGQNAGIAPSFRAQGSEIFQDGQRTYGVRHPANFNAYEGADIVAGPSSVVYGSVTGSGGYINYLSKKPDFEKQKTSISGELGTWYPGEDSRKSNRFTVDNTGPISDDVAYRVSVTRQRSEDFYDNVENNFDAVYAALAFKPTSNVRVDWNASYDNYFDWNVTHGWNRPTQELVDNDKYSAGRATPIVQVGSGAGSQYWSPIYASGAATSAVTGWERRQKNAQGQYVVVAGSQQTAAPSSQASPGTIRGWVYDPTLAGNGLQTLSRQAAQRAEDQNTSRRVGSQLRAQWDISPVVSLVNSTLYQHSEDTTDAATTFQVQSQDSILDNRTEVQTHIDFGVFGVNAHQDTNSGIIYRNEDNRSIAANNSFFNINAYDLTQDPSTKSMQNLLGLTNLNPLGGNGSWIGTPGQPQNSTYFGWLSLLPMYPVGNGDRLYAEATASYTSEASWTTKTLFTQHNFLFSERYGLNVGASRSWISADIENPLADISGNARKDSDRYRLYSAQTSPYFKPTPNSTIYFTLDRSLAVNTGGFANTLSWGSGPTANLLNPLSFHSLSELKELGFKADLIPNELFFSLSGYEQSRDLSPDQYNNIARLNVKGVESTIRYQPTDNFRSGVNLSKLKADYDYLSQAGFASAGFIANNGTVFSDNNVLNGLPSGKFDAVQFPEYTVSAYGDYRFDSGFGVEVSAWWTSNWYLNISETVRVPAEYNVDTKFYYEKPDWTVALNVLNITDEENFVSGLSSATNTFLQPMRGRSLSLSFDYRI